jgi:hypothetical protein
VQTPLPRYCLKLSSILSTKPLTSSLAHRRAVASRTVKDGSSYSLQPKGRGGKSISATITNIIIQLIAGAVGGNAAGAGLKNYDLGTLGNTIAGALGGIGGGQILTALLPMLSGTAENVDIGAVIGQAVGGGVAGAIVTFVVGLIKNTMVGQQSKR